MCDREGEMTTLRPVEAQAARAYRERFGAAPEIVASAPGRVNLIGEHTDYSGGFVLPCAIDRRVAVAAGHGDGVIVSVNYGEERSVGRERDYSWADYPRGVALQLGARAPEGALPPWRAAIAGDVPRGSGLSSSAAIEAATATALNDLFALNLTRRELAVLCRRVENEFLGVKSGIMDQYASLLAQANHALLIDCRSLEARAIPLDLDAMGLSLIVCDTRQERGLRDSEYNSRQEACARAAALLGVAELRDARESDLTRLSGEELRRARHVIGENARVLRAAAALDSRDFTTFGQLMTASHASLRDDYEVSTPALDAFVDEACAQGALGARLTGAGFGGCAIALAPTPQASALQAAVRARFARAGLRAPEFYDVHPASGAEIAS
jgi:galactokinase